MRQDGSAGGMNDGTRFGADFVRDGGGSAVELVASLVQRAVDSGATDIHLEPRRKSLEIRCRVDGFLWSLGEVDLAVGREVI